MLGLVMIAKDEESGIEHTLRSFLPFVNGMLVMDTGSQDRTREIACDLGALVVNEKFHDFSSARNLALDHGRGLDTPWLIMVSGDDVANGIPDFSNQESFDDALFVSRIEDGWTYKQSLVTRVESGWRYSGKTHEVISGPNGEITRQDLPGSLVISKASRHSDSSVRRKRWHLDLEILLEECRLHPLDTRSRFYLAQTFECLGILPHALDSYRLRVELGGWHEERYEAQYRVGRVLAKLGDTASACTAYLKAYQISREIWSCGRAEPLRAIADIMPYPEGASLFVDQSAYRKKP